MKKIYLISGFIWFACALMIFSHPAAAKVYIDVGSPSFKQIPIAISDFNNKTAGTAKAGDYGMTVSEEIKKDLSLTGIFNLLNKKSFLEDQESITATTADKIRFSDWTAIGADYLLRGNITQNDKEIIADSYFFDVTRGELIFNKKYRAAAGRIKDISRAIASEIMLALVNDEGDFNTKIAFISKKGPKADIQMINYDGSELKNITNHQSIILAPRWSPDGKFLAFTSFKGGRPEIYLRNLMSGTEKKAASFEGLNLCGSFSPDGKNFPVRCAFKMVI